MMALLSSQTLMFNSTAQLCASNRPLTQRTCQTQVLLLILISAVLHVCVANIVLLSCHSRKITGGNNKMNGG